MLHNAVSSAALSLSLMYSLEKAILALLLCPILFMFGHKYNMLITMIDALSLFFSVFMDLLG